jgi:hypothetical protein
VDLHFRVSVPRFLGLGSLEPILLGMPKLKVLPLIMVGATLMTFLVAAPPAFAARQLPSGTALVAISGDAATIIKVQPRKYRITFPASQTIKWLGEVRGLPGARIGSFTEQELVSRWADLRRGSKSPARATLSWKGEERWVLSKVSRPRVNREGLLVVDLTTPRSLPPRIMDFNLSIDRASRANNLRWNTTTQTFSLSDITSLEVTVNGNASTSTEGVANGSDCFYSPIPLDGNGHIASVPGLVCGDVEILSMSTIQVIAASPSSQGWEQAVLNLFQGGNTSTWYVIIANWDYQGS